MSTYIRALIHHENFKYVSSLTDMCSSVNKPSDFPFEIKPVDEQTNHRLLADFKGERTGFVQVGPHKYLFPHKYAAEFQEYYDVEVRPDDVWIVTFPRSGTTLTQELIWLVSNNLDYKTASEIPLPYRFPFLEFGLFFHDDVKKEFLNENAHSQLNQELIENISSPGWQILPGMKSPRFIKTHLPISLLPKDWSRKQCKTIYVARNPKDVAVSFYHLNHLFRTQGYSGDFTKYWGYFEQNLQPWMPYWHHVEEGWQSRNEPNMLFLFYENIIEDIYGTIAKVADFFGKSLTPSEINGLKEHLSFENFQNNHSVNLQFLKELKITQSGTSGFIRNGKAKKKNHEFTPALEDRANKWIEDNLKKVSFTLPIKPKVID